MQTYQITEYGNLNETQKLQAVDIFLEGFGHMMTFSKDKTVLRKLFFEIMNPHLFKCYVEQEQVLGIMGIATNKLRPLNFNINICRNLFGTTKGNILSRQMNAIFQAPVVKNDNELYIDILATAGTARGKGVATALLSHAFAMKEFEHCSIEVFSKNEAALNLYKKVGFSIYKEEKFSLLRFAVSGMGYPIKMKKVLVHSETAL